MRAISRRFWNSRVRRSTSDRIRSLCSSRSSRVSSGRLDIARGDADRGQRRPQVVAERRQQRGLQLLALPRQLAGLALLEKLRAFDGDRDDAGQRIERAGLDRTAGRGEQADRLRADSQRHEPDGLAVHRHRPVTGIGAGVGVELERRLRRGERVRQLASIELDRSAPPASYTSQSPSRGTAMATNSRSNRRRDRARQHRERLAAVGHHAARRG